jgi:ferredoxin--NADP+ reductase
MPIYNKETVIEVNHYTDKLFTFKTTRNPSFKFDNGQFTMIGMNGIVRAYSIASSNYEDYLNFISIKVPDGPLTSILQNIKVGDTIDVSAKAVGTLTIDRLIAADELYLLATGTGLAPFMSIIADPDTYEKFNTVIVVHSCRTKAELIYSDYIRNLHTDELLGRYVANKLEYCPTTTQEASPITGRINTLIQNGIIRPKLENSRVMICGNPQMLSDLTEYFTEQGWAMGSLNEPGDFIIEKAFAIKDK